MNKNFKILIKSEENGAQLEVQGTKYSLMYALAHLTSALLKETDLSKEDIEKAVELGLMSKEEVEREAEKKKKEVEEKLQQLFNKMF